MGLGGRGLFRLRGLYSAGLQGQGFQAFATVALALDVEHDGIVKYPVQGAQQGIVLVEVGFPLGRVLVAGEDDVAAALLVVPPVDQIEEQPCVLLVELAVAYLINNETGGPHKAVQDRCLFTGPAGGGELVPQLGHLNEIGLDAPLTAFIPEGLSQMGLAGSGRANEGQIPAGIDGRQRRQTLQSLHIPSLYHGEVKVCKGFGVFQRQAAHLQQGLDGSVHLLLPQMLQNRSHSLKLLRGEFLLLSQNGKLGRGEIQPQNLAAFLYGLKCGLSHPTQPPCQS